MHKAVKGRFWKPRKTDLSQCLNLHTKKYALYKYSHVLMIAIRILEIIINHHSAIFGFKRSKAYFNAPPPTLNFGNTTVCKSELYITFSRTEYFVCISALTEFGGEGPSSPCYMATTYSILSSPLQYTAIVPILVLSVCIAGIGLLIRRLLCRYEGLSARLFKKQRQHYELWGSNSNNYSGYQG